MGAARAADSHSGRARPASRLSANEHCEYTRFYETVAIELRSVLQINTTNTESGHGDEHESKRVGVASYEARGWKVVCMPFPGAAVFSKND